MRKLSALIVMFILIVSCQKENDKEELKSNYWPLDVGNYWVYQKYFTGHDGIKTLLENLDSVIISRDTIINYCKYFVLEGSFLSISGTDWGIVSILRDSSGYIVDQFGKIRFTEYNFTDTLASYIAINNNDTLYTLTYKMEIVDVPLTVPAGTFYALDYKGTVITPKKINDIDNPRFSNMYFSKDVGIIKCTENYFNQPLSIELNLIRYNIEK